MHRQRIHDSLHDPRAWPSFKQLIICVQHAFLAVTQLTVVRLSNLIEEDFGILFIFIIQMLVRMVDTAQLPVGVRNLGRCRLLGEHFVIRQKTALEFC